MKILMLGWELPPHNSGGLGVACHQLCRALSNKGADIEFILPYTQKHDDVDFMSIRGAHPQGISEILKSGIAYDSYKYIYKDGDVEWHDIFSQQAIYEKSISKVVDEVEFDIIHAHDWLTFRAALRAKNLTNKPLIVHIHSIESDRAAGESGNPLVREIESLTMLMADTILAVSEHTKKAIVREYNIPANKIKVVHNSIDRKNLEPLDPENAYGYLEQMKTRGFKVIVNIGRLTRQKNLPNFLRAAQKIVDNDRKTLFLLVGSGDQEYELIELAAELGISRHVIFAGFQRGKRWRDAYAIADLFVMPSVSEPFGLTPFEAIAYGTPSLISKQSGVAEVFRNSLKVDFWDINEMANQITTALRHPSMLNELRGNAIREFEKLSWDKAASEIMALYGQFKPDSLKRAGVA